MTGHGESLAEDSHARVVAEVRAVNNRFLKTNIYCELGVQYQSKIETLIKQHVSRGSVNLKIKTHTSASSEDYKINKEVLQSYWLQVAEVAGASQHVNLESLLDLPGVVEEKQTDDASQSIWPLVEQAVIGALERLIQMRSLEGEAMAKDLRQNCDEIATQLAQIRNLAPDVAANYAERLTDRINSLLKKYDLQSQPADVIREIGIFADKVDVSEEIVRLDSHLQQFLTVMDGETGAGRKLDFLVQEMLRETNTIGSKANHAEIAASVVTIKTAIERIREMVQNIE